jgi:transcription-repair coupling factor (superfamily II helicase)
LDDTLGIALVVAAAFQKQKQAIKIVTSNLYNAQKVYDLLTSLISEEHCLFYPVDELLTAKTIAHSKEMLAQRLYVMGELLKPSPKILVTHVAAALRYIPQPQYFAALKLTFKVGEKVQLEKLKSILTQSGYLRVNKIDQSLQFAIRGDIIDVASVNLPHPVRMELFGDEIESIRYFDIASQTSFEAIHQCEILPATDILFTEQERQAATNKLLKQLNDDALRLSKHDFSQLEARMQDDLEHILHHQTHYRLYPYMGYLSNQPSAILDYGTEGLILVANEEQVSATATLILQESIDYYDQQARQGMQLSRLQMYQELNRVLGRQKYVVTNTSYGSQGIPHFSVRPVSLPTGQYLGLETMIKSVLEQSDKVLFVIATAMQKDNLEMTLQALNQPYQLMDQLSIPTKKVGVVLMHLEEGFELKALNLAVVTSKELFGYRQKVSKYFSRYKEATIIQSHEELTPGDYVVHEYSGIGQYIGIKTMDIDGLQRDYLHIQYGGTDVLYVPLSQFKLVRKFSSSEGATPKLHRLHSKEWEATKKRIKDKVDDLAERLVTLYKNRATTVGFAFQPDDEVQTQFERLFPYQLTPDQQKTLAEIKRDMEQPSPMDRLLCGDVGFGKTEVAFRAAFKAINNHKQVAILCPTTLLARQHYERAIERFATFGIQIAIFSRLIPEAKQKEYREAIKQGTIQLIIGTHRLLAKDIVYQDLGLLIVDEEQRFGVEQKERIKEIKTNVDVLTLSATPIPRTLQISLLGIRQLSQINTSPLNRVPIQTYVMMQDERVIKELIERELVREGQVYYVHNRVDDIYLVAEKIQQTIKGSRVRVVHGQMEKDEIEDVMTDFYNGACNILVCTSIIENGIDVANANLIIVEDASNFGLAQLYQIKGRVGRGNRIAYAYLLYKDGQRLNEQASKRLKAIQEFTELGSGYKIAQRDLMIRGAGDILGPEQAGFIASVGLDMYLQLLTEAIEEKKTGIPTPRVEVAPTLMVNAYIPEQYAEKKDKVELYQMIETAKNFTELDTLQKYIRDLYGRLPEEVETLLKKRYFDILTHSPALDAWQETKAYLDILCADAFTALPQSGTLLFQSLQPQLQYIKVTYAQRKLRIRLFKQGSWFDNLVTIIEAIVKIYDQQSKKE